jgi:hypothetical protein
MAARRSAHGTKWRDWYRGEGRVALAALFHEFSFYSPMEGNDPYLAMRREGQRDVLAHIVRLIGAKPADLADDVHESVDLLERLLRE